VHLALVHPLDLPRRPLTAGLILAAGATAVFAAAWGVERSSAVAGDQSPQSVAIAAFIGAYVALGTYMWWSGSSHGLLMVGAGLLAALAALVFRPQTVPYTAGRVISAVLVVYLVYVFLCFPRNRLHSRVERMLVRGFLVTSIIVWAVAFAVAERLPAAGPLLDCGSGRCRTNDVRLLDTSSATTTATVYLIDGLTTAALAAVAVLLVLKCVSPSRLRRRALVPLALCCAVWIVARTIFVFLRETGVEAGTVVLKPTVAAAAITIPVAMFVGQRRGRLLGARRLATFVAEIGKETVEPAGLESFMREALGDPRLRFLLWRWEEDGYVDVVGSPAKLPSDQDVRTIEIADAGGRPRAAVVHDAALTDSAELVDGLARTSLLILDNDRLVTEMAASQVRIASAAATERIRLERDLHDGAQQRLISLKFALARIGEDAKSGLAEQLETATRHADAAIDDLRTLSQGIYPSVLVEGGLAAALRSVASTASVDVQVYDRNVGRSSAPIEYAVYLCALEAIQNAVKHGGPTVSVRIDLELRDNELNFSIADDGLGFILGASTSDRRSGLVNMRDRIGSVGGALTISSSPGAGATIYGSVRYPPVSDQQ
jgi:signal transduction histidine kinase